MQLTGDLQKVSLPNLIQLIRNGGLTGKIALSRGAQQALIGFEKGSVVHAEQELNHGRETLMELFLWNNGTFAFTESDMTLPRRSIDGRIPSESTEALLKDGIAYAEQQEFLEQMNVDSQTVFAIVDAGLKRNLPQDPGLTALLDCLDGKRNLTEILAASRLPRRLAVGGLYKLVLDRIIVAREDSAEREGTKVELPDWVLARLRQDNQDISKAIVDMVIWVDRIKCWLYQADAEFGEILTELDTLSEEQSSTTSGAPLEVSPGGEMI
jgi:hypothetical protein